MTDSAPSYDQLIYRMALWNIQPENAGTLDEHLQNWDRAIALNPNPDEVNLEIRGATRCLSVILNTNEDFPSGS